MRNYTAGPLSERYCYLQLMSYARLSDRIRTCTPLRVTALIGTTVLARYAIRLSTASPLADSCSRNLLTLLRKVLCLELPRKQITLRRAYARFDLPVSSVSDSFRTYSSSVSVAASSFMALLYSFSAYRATVSICFGVLSFLNLTKCVI